MQKYLEILKQHKKTIIYAVGSAAIAVLIICIGTYAYLVSTLPNLNSIEDYQPNLITNVYSAKGNLIGEYFHERRVVVAYDTLPQHLIDAFIAIEDSKFYEHKGLDYLSILRAAGKNIKAGRLKQGGSTITQQVARSFFLSNERKFSRKLREAILAFRIEKRFSKEEILHLYLNQIYLGSGTYGVHAAAQKYFGKSVTDLSIAESAVLAGLPKAPSNYSPYINPTRSRDRQQQVISKMLEDGYITTEQADTAENEELVFESQKRPTLWVGQFFTEHVRRYIEEKYGENLLYTGGLKVYTTLDVNFQRAANEAVEAGLQNHDRRRGYRGAVETLETDEAKTAFMEKQDKELVNSPLRQDKTYLALVTEVDKKKKTLKATIGSNVGVIKYTDFSWTKLYNPTKDPDGSEFKDPLKIFLPGQVIEVSIKDLPPEGNEEALIKLRLEQTPLAEASLLSMDPATGYIRAMVGGSDFAKTQFNRAIQAKRQPGSAFKAIIYSTALDMGYTPATVVVDSPIVFKESGGNSGEKWEWKPRNYGEKFYGPTTVRTAVTKSRNVVTIKVLQDIGVRNAIEMARNLGVESPLASDLSLALGSSAVTLLEMTKVFATISNNGARTEPVFITKVEDRYGNVLEENLSVSVQAMEPQTAYVMNKLLQGVVQNGTGRRARALGRPTGGKTGTTNNLNDAWFMGFVKGLTTGVWIGYDSEKPLGNHETGARAALPIWVSFMKKALSNSAPENFPIPEGVEFARIDAETGLLATPSTKNAIFEVFKVGTAPTEVSTRGGSTGGENFFLLDAGEKTIVKPDDEYYDGTGENKKKNPLPANL